MKRIIFTLLISIFLTFSVVAKNDGGGGGTGGGSGGSGGSSGSSGSSGSGGSGNSGGSASSGPSGQGYSYTTSGYDGELKKILFKVEKEQDYSGSLKALEEYVYANPDNADGWNLIGFVSRKLGNFEDAEVYYATGLEIEPNHDDILAYQGQLYLETNRYDMALKNLVKLTDLCKFNCDEKIELSKAIKEYELENNL